MTTDACPSRTTLFGTTYYCDQPAGHTGDHVCHTSMDEWMEWAPDAPPTAIAVTDHTGSAATCTHPSCVQRRTQPATQATDPYRVLDRLDRGKTPTADELAALRDAFNAARTVDAPWLRAAHEDTAAARQGEAEAVRAREAAEQRNADNWTRAEAAERDLRILRSGLRANGADPTQIQNLWAQIRMRNGQWRHEKRRADAAEAFRDAAYEALGIADGQLPETAISAINGRAANIAELHERAGQAEATIERVREIHQNDRWHCGTCADEYGSAAPWPCPTAAALDSGSEPATGTVHEPDDDARSWIAEALGLDIETSWGVIADAARTMRHELTEARAKPAEPVIDAAAREIVQAISRIVAAVRL